MVASLSQFLDRAQSPNIIVIFRINIYYYGQEYAYFGRLGVGANLTASAADIDDRRPSINVQNFTNQPAS